MIKNLNIIEYEDPSLKNLLKKTADQLHKKYNKQRKINKKYLKQKNGLQKAISIFLDVFCTVLFLIGFVVCFSIINATVNGYMPNFAGYSNLIVSSKSMEASGFNVGDVVIVHSVDTDTLNVNDKISFYDYPRSYQNFEVDKCENISNQSNKTKYTLTFKQLFGFQTEEIKMANNSNSNIIFHHISAIYQDQNGERWFKTYGSSNGGDDGWWINEKYVVGIQDESGFAKCVVELVEFASKPYGVIVIGIPAIILIFSLVLSILKNIQIAKLELDCVEEKRKITDDICVKNNVGFQMSKKVKYKILAQATDDDIKEYIQLLWQNGSAPNSIKKYYLRKNLLVSANQKLLKLNRECEKMFKRNIDPNKIAKHYLAEKSKIETEHQKVRENLKKINKRNK